MLLSAKSKLAFLYVFKHNRIVQLSANSYGRPKLDQIKLTTQIRWKPTWWGCRQEMTFHFGTVVIWSTQSTVLTVKRLKGWSEAQKWKAAVHPNYLSSRAVALETVSKGAFSEARPRAKPQKNLPLLQRMNSGQVNIHSLWVNPAPPTTPLFQTSHYVPFSLTPLHTHTHTQLQQSPQLCASMCGWSKSMFMKSKARIS